jgi:hypothetical protein
MWKDLKKRYFKERWRLCDEATGLLFCLRVGEIGKKRKEFPLQHCEKTSLFF